MSETLSLSAKCLCKKVSLNAKRVKTDVDACHCNTCRKWSGSPLLALDCGNAVDIEGLEHVKVFDSSQWAQRGFCQHCGTHLFYRLKQNQHYIVPAGLFDCDEKLTLSTQIFIEQKPEYYSFADSTKNMTGEQVFAAFANPS